MSSRQKRPLSPEATIPPEDCTRDTFDQHANLSDRQFLCWALQTETRLRFSKLEGRGSSSVAQDTTLNSEYLIDLYPSIGETKDETGKLARERHAFARKSIPYLHSMRDPDFSFETLTRLQFEQPQSTNLKKNKSGGKSMKCLPIPPNLLFFEIILEAYMGYRVPAFHSADPSQPRAAIMGGAVVAALTAWRVKSVLEAFHKVEKDLQKALESDDVVEYQSTKDLIRTGLHQYFLHQNSANARSIFSLGDVDIFLQASPLTRSLLNEMKDIPLEVKDVISSYLGGSGYVHQDLKSFAANLCTGHLAPLFRDTGNYSDAWQDTGSSKFCYALTRNGLSFALGVEDNHAIVFDPKVDTWPRTTQLIMLNEKADLVGGLMDFDISVASCAYDGVSVYVTPRCVFSLKTLTQVVTPFVYEERRNRSRITKYYKRGFDAFLLDPYCCHGNQCAKNGNIITENKLDTDKIKVADWRAHELTSRDRYDQISDAQEEKRRSVTWPDSPPGIFVCGCDMSTRSTYKYSIALIEKSEGHAIEYFSKREQWSEEFRQEVMSAPEEERYACIRCREEYGLQLVLDGVPSSLRSVPESVDDILRGDLCYKNSQGWSGFFRPSFYNGGVFSSEFVGKDARSAFQLVGVMRAQEIFEEARYIRRHGSSKGHRVRFVYGDDLDEVFRDAEHSALPANGRAPVGLNPERFIARCEECQQWLHACEFNVKYCENCAESKPAAVDD